MSTRDCGLDPQDSLSCKFLSAREDSQARLGLDSLSSWREVKSDRGERGSALLPEDSVGQLNDSSRQIYSIVFTLILSHSITQMEIFTKIFLLSNKNHWGSILFAQIIQKNNVFQKVHLWQETMSTSDKWNIFNISVQNIFPKLRDIFVRRIKNVIRPSSPRPDDRSKLSVGLGLPLKNYPNFIKLGFSWNVSSFQSPPGRNDQWASQCLEGRLCIIPSLGIIKKFGGIKLFWIEQTSQAGREGPLIWN